MVPLVTFIVGDSELVIHFQEAYARLFSNCYNKQGIRSNLPPYKPMNQRAICAKVYPEGIQPVKGNNCGLIPYELSDLHVCCLAKAQLQAEYSCTCLKGSPMGSTKITV